VHSLRYWTTTIIKAVRLSILALVSSSGILIQKQDTIDSPLDPKSIVALDHFGPYTTQKLPASSSDLSNTITRLYPPDCIVFACDIVRGTPAPIVSLLSLSAFPPPSKLLFFHDRSSLQLRTPCYSRVHGPATDHYTTLISQDVLNKAAKKLISSMVRHKTTAGCGCPPWTWLDTDADQNVRCGAESKRAQTPPRRDYPYVRSSTATSPR
jgi:hypothetical protein